MTHYNRRAFLKALGLTAAALTAPTVAGADPEITQVFRQLKSGDSFSWEFWGECALGPFSQDPNHMALTLISAEAPPEGFTFFARSLWLGVREDCKLADLKHFLGQPSGDESHHGWSVSMKSGSMTLIEAPVYVLLTGMGLGVRPGPYSDHPLVPQIAVKPDFPLTISIHGKPFEMDGPPMIVGAQIIGIGVKS